MEQILNESSSGTTMEEMSKGAEDRHDGVNEKVGNVAMQHFEVETLRQDLDRRFNEVEERFRRKWAWLEFHEEDIESDFRDETFYGQKKYINAVVFLSCLYLGVAAILYNAVPLGRLSQRTHLPPITCFNGLNMSYPVTHLLNGTVNVTMTAGEYLALSAASGDAPAYSSKWAVDLLNVAAVFRSVSILLGITVVGVLRYGSRKAALGAIVVAFWLSCIFFDLAFSYESIVESVNDAHVLLPLPNPSLPPLLFLMLVYTVGIPGIPFITACLCGWGVILTSLISHLLVWGGRGVVPDWAGMMRNDADLSGGLTDPPPDTMAALGKQLMRMLLFNIFGTFGARCGPAPTPAPTPAPRPRPARMLLQHARVVQLACMCTARLRSLF